MKKLSDRQRLEIANICYANVAGMFADLCGRALRGHTVDWQGFPERCQRHSESWLWIHHARANTDAGRAAAKEFSKEIADNLLWHSEVLVGPVKDQ